MIKRVWFLWLFLEKKTEDGKVQILSSSICGNRKLRILVRGTTSCLGKIYI